MKQGGINDYGQGWAFDYKRFLDAFFSKLHSDTILGLEFEFLNDKTCDSPHFQKSEVLADTIRGTI
jgi:hypothetical protein